MIQVQLTCLLQSFSFVDVDPPFVTTDPDVFQQELASVSVQGGGDCPEMSLTGKLDFQLNNSR
jgi:hypothetical protein